MLKDEWMGGTDSPKPGPYSPSQTQQCLRVGNLHFPLSYNATCSKDLAPPFAALMMPVLPTMQTICPEAQNAQCRTLECGVTATGIPLTSGNPSPGSLVALSSEQCHQEPYL